MAELMTFSSIPKNIRDSYLCRNTLAVAVFSLLCRFLQPEVMIPNCWVCFLQWQKVHSDRKREPERRDLTGHQYSFSLSPHVLARSMHVPVWRAQQNPESSPCVLCCTADQVKEMLMSFQNLQQTAIGTLPNQDPVKGRHL